MIPLCVSVCASACGEEFGALEAFSVHDACPIRLRLDLCGRVLTPCGAQLGHFNISRSTTQRSPPTASHTWISQQPSNFWARLVSIAIFGAVFRHLAEFFSILLHWGFDNGGL